MGPLARGSLNPEQTVEQANGAKVTVKEGTPLPYVTTLALKIRYGRSALLTKDEGPDSLEPAHHLVVAALRLAKRSMTDVHANHRVNGHDDLPQ